MSERDSGAELRGLANKPGASPEIIAANALVTTLENLDAMLAKTAEESTKVTAALKAWTAWVAVATAIIAAAAVLDLFLRR